MSRTLSNQSDTNQSDINRASDPHHDRSESLVVPESLRVQLKDFRNQVWTAKLFESLVVGAGAVLLAFLTVYACDRVWDTSLETRTAMFSLALLAWIAVPWALHRWVWRNRSLDQLARLLRVRQPAIGDQLLSVIELSENRQEQARSRRLCEAAISQVAEAAKQRDFGIAAPPTRLRGLTPILVGASLATLILAGLFPGAAANAWLRFLLPWQTTPRFTFTTVEPLPDRLIVPHGETAGFQIELDEESQWQPADASLTLGDLPPLTTPLSGRAYAFEIPPQVTPVSLLVRTGDFYQGIQLEPKVRPELLAASATISFPEYLQRSQAFQQDVRSGILSVVEGCTAVIHATASRDLYAARIDEENVVVRGAEFSSKSFGVEGDEHTLKLQWRDRHGLAGREPFELSIRPQPDEMPSVVSQGLPRQSVVLETEQINFQAMAADDFGIRAMGIAWQGIDEQAESCFGEKLLAAGAPERSSMQIPAVFSASKLGITPQPIEVRLWVEDYLPGRERVFSVPHVFFVLTKEQHALWISDQLSKWHQASLEVRDQELQLHASNKRLRNLPSGELTGDEVRGELRRQASLEKANARRLSSLAKTGENLLRQAARNREIGVEHLERWAEMLQVLNDIGRNRMPSVAELLTRASQKESGSSKKASSGPQVGLNRMNPSGGPENSDDAGKSPESDQRKLPSISDGESSMQPAGESSKDSSGNKKSGGKSRLSLPSTTLAGPPPKDGGPRPQSSPKDESPLEQAVEEQADLLAEFERIADELNGLLANLEGSTLVKRLKAASRAQDQVAVEMGGRIDAFFGQDLDVDSQGFALLRRLRQAENQCSVNVSYIMDDMQSYFERRRMNQFKLVLDEMRDSKVLVALRELGDAMTQQQGVSIAQAEFWADSLDRWAEDLVGPASKGKSSGSKDAASLPPALILEVMQILEGEVNLRESTRVAEQGRPAMSPVEHQDEARGLSNEQNALRERTANVLFALAELPDAPQNFGNEMELLSEVSAAMHDAETLLAGRDTGADAVAAETEAIELLLQSNRINPQAGGGGGTSPGGGGTGTTQESALALLGSGLNQNERREARDVTQATGESGRELPEEFRAGLDEYFNRLENGQP